MNGSSQASPFCRKIERVFLLVVLCVVAISSVATLNAMVASVVERRRQLGILWSLGATGTQIRWMMMAGVRSVGLVVTTFGVLVRTLGHWVGAGLLIARRCICSVH